MALGHSQYLPGRAPRVAHEFLRHARCAAPRIALPPGVPVPVASCMQFAGRHIIMRCIIVHFASLLVLWWPARRRWPTAARCVCSVGRSRAGARPLGIPVRARLTGPGTHFVWWFCVGCAGRLTSKNGFRPGQTCGERGAAPERAGRWHARARLAMGRGVVVQKPLSIILFCVDNHD